MVGDRQKPWRCQSCGVSLGVLLFPARGYVRLWPDLAALTRIEVEGHEVRHTCRCGAMKVWRTQKAQDAA